MGNTQYPFPFYHSIEAWFPQAKGNLMKRKMAGVRSGVKEHVKHYNPFTSMNGAAGPGISPKESLGKDLNWKVRYIYTLP